MAIGRWRDRLPRRRTRLSSPRALSRHLVSGDDVPLDHVADPPPHLCEAMQDLFALGAGRGNVAYDPAFREYSILLDPQPVPPEYADDPEAIAETKGDVIFVIGFCPFDGAPLPPSLRDVWFEELEALGIAPPDDVVPPDFRSSRWWRDLGR